MSGLLRLVPLVGFGSRRSFHILERNATLYRRNWVLLASGFFEPLFYLLSLGLGLNSLVGNLEIGGVQSPTPSSSRPA
jgi:lipooligosaccharide transport system permease protein